METLIAIYLALTVFGMGVTIVDLFGALDHGSGGGHDSAGHGDAGHGAIGHDASGHGDAGHAGHDIAADHGASDHPSASHDAAHAAVGDHAAAGHGDGHGAKGDGALLGSARGEAVPSQTGQDRSAAVARIVSGLRTIVYFALGAGPTGLAAMAMKLGALSSVLWAAGAGFVIAALARVLRRVLRKDLDSSFTAEDFILEEAEVTVPVSPGLMGKAIVKKYGAQAEVYVRATSPEKAFIRGDLVRIIDFQDDCYLVEAADEEHLVR